MIGLSLTGIRAQPAIPYLSKQEDTKPHAPENGHVVATLNLIGSDETVESFTSQQGQNHQLLFSNEKLRDMMSYVNSKLAHPILYQAESNEASEVETQTDIAASETLEVTPEADVSDAESMAESVAFDADDIAYAFAKFDDLLLSMRRREYEKLPGLEKDGKEMTSLKKNLIGLENGLEGIKEIFKDESLFEEIPEDISKEKLQSLIKRMTTIEAALKPLGSALQNIKATITSLKDQLPTKTHAYILRAVTVSSTIASIVLAVFAISMAPISVAILAISFGLETRNYLLERTIEKWEAFERSLKDFKKYNPVKEKKVFQALLTHMGQVDKKVDTAVNAYQANQAVNQNTQQELENTKAKLADVEKQLEISEEARLRDRRQFEARFQMLEAKFDSGQAPVESATTTSEKSANQIKTESKLRLVA